MHFYEKFIKASQSHPCPICGKNDWCGFNNYLASCMRIKEGSYKTIVQSNGKEAYQHRLKPGTVNVPHIIGETKSAVQTASVEVRNQIYKELLRLLTLNQRHRDDLLRRGLSESDIKQNRYKSVPDNKPWNICRRLLEKGHDLSGIPGFYKAWGPHGGSYWTFNRQPGYFIPILDSEGRIQALQKRMDDPSRGGKYKLFSGYISRGGCSSETPAHIARPEKVKDSRIWITEGPLKSDIAAKYLGAIVIGALSTGTWKTVLEPVLELGAKEIVMAFDMDAVTNRDVARSEEALVKELLKNGLQVKRAIWKTGKGIDDVLVATARKKHTA